MPSQDQSRLRVVVCMGSQSDWDTMREAAAILDTLAVAHEVRIISAHRTPDRLSEFARTAVEDGVGVIIAGAGGAAHLPGMSRQYPASGGVPVESKSLKGMDCCCRLSRCGRVPLAPIGAAARNAGLLAAQIRTWQLAGRLQSGAAISPKRLPKRRHDARRRHGGPQWIGILGGGQLGRMLAIAAARLIENPHLRPRREYQPGRRVATCTTSASYDDMTALRALQPAWTRDQRI